MMTEEERKTLSDTLADVCRDVFADQEPSFETVPEPPLRFDDVSCIVAVIGLGGDNLRGSLVLAAKPTFYEKTFPSLLPGQVPNEVDLCDWAGEMANQFLGRLKNRFVRLGLDFNVGTPTVVRGERLHIKGWPRASVLGRLCRIGGEDVTLHFEVEREGAPLFNPTEVDAVSPEGESLLF